MDRIKAPMITNGINILRVNFKYLSYGTLNRAKVPMVVALGYIPERKFNPIVKADIRRICPPAAPILDVANRAMATAPRIGIVIPATPLVDCRKNPIPI